MKLEQQKRNIKSQGISTQANFGISTADQAHILNILRSKLYSDKILAVLREYSTNAADAHAEAGIPNKPIKISLPNRLHPTLSIRDYGKGLSEEQITKVYTQYGASTKRNSNSAVGQLGIGCKSAFAYTDAFSIISYCNGLKTTYHAYIDESEVGIVAKMDERPTDEPSGIEIQIAVKKEDVPRFISKAKDFFRYFKPCPEFEGSVTIEQDEKLIEGKNWYIKKTTHGHYYSSHTSYVVMGNIPYPINPDEIVNYADREDTTKISSLLTNGLVLYAPIGELEISASRESLEYKEKTKKFLYNLLINVLDEIKIEIENKLKVCKTSYEARMMADEMKNRMICQLGLQDTLVWNGKLLENEVALPTADDLKEKLKERFSLMFKRSSGRTKSWGDYDLIRIVNLGGVILKDTKSAPIQRAASIQSDKGYHTVLVYTPTDNSLSKKEIRDEAKQLLSEIMLDGIPIYYASDGKYDPDKTPTTKSTSSLGKPQRSKVYLFDEGKKHRHGEWKKVKDGFSLQDKVYIRINRFTPYKNKLVPHIEGLRWLLARLEDLGLNRPEVYGVKKRYVDRVPDSWITLTDYVKEEVSKLIKSHKSKLYYYTRVDEYYERFSMVMSFYYTFIPQGVLDKIPNELVVQASKGLLGKVIRATCIKSNQFNKLNKLYRKISDIADRIPNLEDELDKVTYVDVSIDSYEKRKQWAYDYIKKYYPMLEWVPLRGSSLQSVLEYISLMDEQSQKNNKAQKPQRKGN